MKHKLLSFGALRLSDTTNNLIYAIADICKKNKIGMNGDDVSWSVILRYPFEKIAHSQHRDEKISMLTELLLFAHAPHDDLGTPLTREQIEQIAREVFK